MGFGLTITSDVNATGTALGDDVMLWLTEARLEMELSKPTRYALRFENDLCSEKPRFDNENRVKAGALLGIFASLNGELECLAYGPVTETKSANVLGGVGSWIEMHGEDRRVEMGRVGVQATYSGRASDAVGKILRAHKFKPDTQQTIIDYGDNKLTQSATDLAFVEDLARRNNMEFWIDYKASRASDKAPVTVTETANFRTSPSRAQPGDIPQVPTLVAPKERVLSVNPPRGDCATVNRFEAKVNYERPTSARGFAATDQEDQAIVRQLANPPEPLAKDKEVVQIEGVKREAISAPAPTKEEAFLAKEALVNEQSWFVEVECSSTLEQLDFVVRPHQIVEVAHAGDQLSGAYQVMKAVHVVTSTDHFMDFTLRANGLGRPA